MVETMVSHQLRKNGSGQTDNAAAGKAFAEICAQALSRKDGIHRVFFSDGPNDKGIDFYKIGEDGHIVIAQCKYDDDGSLYRVQSEADKVQDFINEISEKYINDSYPDPHSAPFNMPRTHDVLFDAIVKSCATEGGDALMQKISYYFFMASAAHGDCQAIEKKVKDRNKFGEVCIYTGDDIAAMSDYKPKHEDGVPRLSLGITVEEAEGGRRAFAKLDEVNEKLKQLAEAEHRDYEPIDMFTTMVWPDDLAKAVGSEFEKGYGYSRLFCDNVRDFLGNKGLSDAMIQTLMDSPQYFPLFNNGLAVICSGTETNQNSNSLDLICGAIVNGGQTTGTLYKNYKAHDGADMSLAPVICTVMIVRNEEIRKQVSICRNTQGKVEIDSKLSLNENTVLLSRHLEYEDFHLTVRRGTDGRKDETKPKKADPLRSYSSIKKIAQSFAVFAVHQPIIGRNSGTPILSNPAWLKNLFRGDYSQSNTPAAYIAAIGILDNCLDALSKKYKKGHSDAQTDGLRYLALYLLGIQGDMLYRAASCKKNQNKRFYELGFDIPMPLTIGDFGRKYSNEELDIIMPKITLPEYEMSINSTTSTDDILAILSAPQPGLIIGTDENGNAITTDFIDWLYRDVERRSAEFPCSISEGIKNNGQVQKDVAEDFCKILRTSSYGTYQNVCPFLALIDPCSKRLEDILKSGDLH